MIGTLKKTIEKEKARPLRHQSPQRRAEKAFTFEQFKAVIGKNGPKPSEQILQKSYEALVKLRNREHWSWIEARRKVEESRQDLTAASLSKMSPSAVGANPAEAVSSHPAEKLSLMPDGCRFSSGAWSSCVDSGL
jgi:hypothetical protein